MLSNLADLHRSRLETLLAIEVEYQRKLIALSNQRIGAIKKLLTDVDALHQDLEGDELLSMGLPEVDSSSDSVATASPAKGDKKGKHKNKKALLPTKPVKLAAGKAPRLIDALQMVIRNKKMGAKEAHALLKARNWLPKSKDPLGYIRFTLSDEKDIFHRVEGDRGIYELEPSNPYYSGKGTPHVKSTKKAAPPEEPPKSGPRSSPKSSPKAVAAPSPPVSESEPPPSISDADSHSVVDAILSGEIPVDG